jgi:leucyl-tRNA synthetase
MIAVNELSAQKCISRRVIEDLTILISPYAPHFAEEMWEHLGKKDSVTVQPWPGYNPAYLEDTDFEYPVSFNGKMRFKMALPVALDVKAVEQAVLSSPEADKYLEGKNPKKVIVVHKRIVNVVV